MSRHLLFLPSSSTALRIKRLRASFPYPTSMHTHRYSGISKEIGGHESVEERAPSTAEEFKRVAEEKARQGFASQTVEKAQNGAEETFLGECKVESAKERCKEPVGRDNFHKTGDG